MASIEFDQVSLCFDRPSVAVGIWPARARSLTPGRRDRIQPGLTTNCRAFKGATVVRFEEQRAKKRVCTVMMELAVLRCGSKCA